MLNILAYEFAIDHKPWFEIGLEFLHGDELQGGTIQYWDPEDEKWWFCSVDETALLGKALSYFDGEFSLTEYDDELLYELLTATTVMDVYDNWTKKVSRW